MKRNTIQSILLLGLLSVFLTNCSLNRSQTGVLGTTTTTAGCVALGVENPYVMPTCAVTAFAGAEIMYKSDYDVHNAVFVDHLNTSPNYGQSYTNWYNSKTGNSIIKVTLSLIHKDL